MAASSPANITASSFVLGPATLYVGDFGATEPADAAVNTSPATSAWTDVGATMDGIKVTIKETYVNLDCDQAVDPVGGRKTSRLITVETAMAETTLTNLQFALNDGTSASGSGWSSFTPDITDSGDTPTYRALVLDGAAPGTDKRRRLIVRKILNTDGIEYAYSKDKQTVFSVKWTAYYVNNTTPPIKFVDEV